jgi:hypothetical protein
MIDIVMMTIVMLPLDGVDIAVLLGGPKFGITQS